jgi:hypothetical protein
MTVLFTRFLAQSPLYLVWLGGAILALVRWQQHPRVSLLALAGLGVLFVNSLAGVALNATVPMMITSGAMRGGRMGTILGVCSIVSTVASAVGYGLLLAAVFSGRAAGPAVEKEA